MLVSLSNKVAGPQAFSCEICQIFKNMFFYRTSPVAVSGFSEGIKTERRKTQFNLEYWGPKDRKVQA